MSAAESAIRRILYETTVRRSNEFRVKVFQEINDEINRAQAKHPKDTWSPHEFYGILKEEFDEVWDEIKQQKFNPQAMKKEAIQMGAVIVRYLAWLEFQDIDQQA